MTEDEQKLIGLLASIAVQPCQKPRLRSWLETPVLDDCEDQAKYYGRNDAKICLPCKANDILSTFFHVRIGRPSPEVVDKKAT